MQVLFVTDFSLKHSSGGSQRNTSILLEEGRKRGHNIVEHNYDSSIINTIRKWDVVISSNLEAFSRSNASILPFLINHPCHIRSERDSCSYLQPKARHALFTSTKANIFLSNYHAEFFKAIYGDYFANNNVVYSPIDIKRFSDVKAEKEFDVVYCGYIHPLKGLKNLVSFARENKERDITVFGWGDQSSELALQGLSNVIFKGKVDYEEIPGIFQRTKHIYHSPVVREPFCRMVAEAMFCGAELVGAKDKIGVALEVEKHGLDEVRKRSALAPQLFWDTVESTHETNN